MQSVIVQGKRYKSIAEARRVYGISEDVYYKRRQRGWGVIESIITPIKANQWG